MTEQALDSVFMKRFTRLINEEFPSITTGEALQCLMSAYVNSLQELKGPTMTHNFNFGKNLFHIACKKYAEKTNQVIDPHWGNEPVEGTK